MKAIEGSVQFLDQSFVPHFPLIDFAGKTVEIETQERLGSERVLSKMFFVSAIALNWLLSAAVAAMAQSANTDTLFRAAYCLGVIEVYFPTEEKMIGARFDTCDVQWRDWGFDSSTMCKLGMGVTYNGSKQDGATRYRRYWQYLQFAGPKIGTAEYSELAQVTGKGRANTQEIASQRPDGLDGLVPESCRQQCPEPTKDLASMINNIEACSLPCTEQLDPVRANILRWVSLSDHLPF